MATKHNFNIDAGTSLEFVIDVDNETDIDLSEFTATAKLIRHYLAASNTAILFTCSINTTANTVTLAMTHAVTANLEPGRYVYDVILTSAANTVARLVEGMITVNPKVT